VGYGQHSAAEYGELAEEVDALEAKVRKFLNTATSVEVTALQNISEALWERYAIEAKREFKKRPRATAI
jgi:hypothetical protein